MNLDKLIAEAEARASYYIEAAAIRGRAMATPRVPSNARLFEDCCFDLLQSACNRVGDYDRRRANGIMADALNCATWAATRAMAEALKAQAGVAV